MADAYVTINSLKLDRSGFCVARDLTPLLESGPLRGSDFVAHGVAGSTFRAKVRGSHSVLVPFLVFGLVDSAGASHPDPFSGVRDNVAEIEAACVTGSASATVTATVTFPDAGTLSGSVYCPRLDVGMHQTDRTGSVAAVVLEIVIPGGVLS